MQVSGRMWREGGCWRLIVEGPRWLVADFVREAQRGMRIANWGIEMSDGISSVDCPASFMLVTAATESGNDPH